MRQFSLRDLLFLVVIVALALGWWFDKRPAPARYQWGQANNMPYVLDTATGQVWVTGMSGFYDQKTLENES